MFYFQSLNAEFAKLDYETDYAELVDWKGFAWVDNTGIVCLGG